MIIFVDIECVDIHEFLCAGNLVFLNNRTRESRSKSMPKLRKFVHKKSKTLFRIASNFLTNIKYSHRVPNSIFVEIML